jgi:outer membrane protein W
MKSISLNLVLLFCTCFAMGQDVYKMGARSTALANASVALDDVWAYHHNPGMSGFAKEFGVGVHYENRFFLRELQYQAITLVQPLKIGVLSAGGQYSGFDLYRSTRAGMGYSLLLSEKLALGMQLNYLNIRQPAEYGIKHGVSAEVGLAAKINKKWMFGASVYNISRTQFASYQDERFATVMRIGATYSVSEKLRWLMEVEKDIVAAIRLKGALEYEPITDFFLRLGVTSNPLEYSFGFGYTFQWLRIDLASSYKQLLGFTTGVSLQFVLDKR